MDEPKIESSMGIIYNGPGVMNNINDSLNHYNGNIGIETEETQHKALIKKLILLNLETC